MLSSVGTDLYMYM